MFDSNSNASAEDEIRSRIESIDGRIAYTEKEIERNAAEIKDFRERLTSLRKLRSEYAELSKPSVGVIRVGVQYAEGCEAGARELALEGLERAARDAGRVLTGPLREETKGPNSGLWCHFINSDTAPG